MNHNHNEYEIIDTNHSPYPPHRNNDHSRYPYANNPNQSLQHTGYKDVFNVTNYQCKLPPSIDWSAVSATALNIAGTVIGGPSGETGAVILTVNNLISLFWPPNNPARVWEDFIIQGNQSLPNREITEAVKSLVIGKLNGLRDSFKAYQEALDNWKSNKNEPNRDAVKFRFEYAVREISSALAGDISLPTYEVLLLPTYTQAALLHLTLLHEGISYENDWQLARNTASLYRSELYKAIETHINYCEKWYQYGLDTIKGTTGVTWYAYNTYRREYTISVLNIMSSFLTFDLRKYPINREKIKREITEKIYTTLPEVENILGNRTIQDIEKALIPPLDFVTWLLTLRLYTLKDTAQTGANNQNVLSGVQNFYQYTLGNSKTGDTYGIVSPVYKDITLPAPNISIFSNLLTSYSHFANITTPYLGIRDIKFRTIDTNTRQIINLNLEYNSNGTSNQVCEIESPFSLKNQNYPTTEDYNYRLSFLTIPKFLTEFVSSLIYAQAWTHKSVDPTNSVQARDLQGNYLITQIPAVKANLATATYPTLPNGIKVIQGPGHTGGPLVTFYQHDDVIRLTCKFIDSANYYIRIRYASSYTGFLIINFNNTSTTLEIKNTNASPNFDEIKYENFFYEITEEYFQINASSTPYQELFITYKGIAQVAIDQIEFIPAQIKNLIT